MPNPYETLALNNPAQLMSQYGVKVKGATAQALRTPNPHTEG